MTGAGVLGFVGAWWVARPSPPAGAHAGAGPPDPTSPAASPVDSTPVGGQKFARVGQLELHVPAERPFTVAFHQATDEEGLPMRPFGRPARNANRWQFDPPPFTDGPRYIVQASRGRGTGATTAVDIVMHRGASVLAPVTGRVVRAKRYRLYGRYPDWRVEIRPDAFPGFRVVIIHLQDVVVRRGDQVFATITRIGTPRTLPFHSVVNDYVKGGDPHVHIEVKQTADDVRTGEG